MGESLDQILLGQTISLEDQRLLRQAELLAQRASKHEDAWGKYIQLNGGHPLKTLMDRVAHKVREAILLDQHDLETLYHAQQVQPRPELFFVSGAPGSGKSQFHRTLPQAVYYLSADVCKRHLKEALQEEWSLEGDPRWQNDGFLHRWSSALAWEAFPRVLDKGFPLLIETLGTDPEWDKALLKQALDQQYQLHLVHVATTTQRAIECAIARFFQEGPDKGRHISLLDIQKRQAQSFAGFQSLQEWLKEQPGSHHIQVFDNTKWAFELQYQWNASQEQGVLDWSKFKTRPMEHKLWFEGQNHTADLVLLAPIQPNLSQSKNLEDWQVALIQRGMPPFEGSWALPGGFVNTSVQKGERFELDIETPEQAARREFEEETLGVLDHQVPLVPLGMFDDIRRDPRNTEKAFVVSHAFLAQLPETIVLSSQGNDDAVQAKWVSLKDWHEGKYPLAFDHDQMLRKALEKAKIEMVNEEPPSLTARKKRRARVDLKSKSPSMTLSV